MNKQEQIKFETAEEMVTYISQRHHEAANKWRLCSHSYEVWVDEAAGKAWQEAESANINRYPYKSTTDSKEYKAYLEEDERLRKSRPAEKKVSEYYIFSEGGWRGTKIYLSETLYNQLDSVWTKSPAYRGSARVENKARLTIPGMLKRLGNTDIGEKINQVKKEIEERQVKISRNNARKQIRETSQKLYTLLMSTNVVDWDADKTDKGIHFFEVLSKLQNVVDEE